MGAVAQFIDDLRNRCDCYKDFRAFLQLMWVIRRPGLVLAIETPGQVLAYEKSKNALAKLSALGSIVRRNMRLLDHPVRKLAAEVFLEGRFGCEFMVLLLPKSCQRG
jgi:hypothetical protein